MSRYLRIFLIFSRFSLKTTFQGRLGIILFIIGKIIRFFFLFMFVFVIFSHSRGIKGYNLNQALIVYMTFNLIDTVSQILFREVYRFRPLVVSGRFDLVLVKPYHPFIQILLGGVDFLDVIMLFPYLGLTLYLIAIGGYLYPGKLALYLFFIFNGLIFATAFHILVLAIGIITTTVDHTIMIYRDLTSVGRFPIEIYREPVRFIFTFVFPIALMTNVPAHILMGKNQGNLFAYGLVFSFGLLLISVYLWQLALKKYQSYGG